MNTSEKNLKTTTKKSSSTHTFTQDSTDYSKNEEIIQRDEILGTPFMCITVKEGSFGAIGEYRVTQIYEKKSDVKEFFDIKNISWDKIATLIACVNHKERQILNQK